MEKICPLLEAKGVFQDNAGLGADKNWVKELCKHCPVPLCIYEKPGRMSEIDREALEKVANE